MGNNNAKQEQATKAAPSSTQTQPPRNQVVYIRTAPQSHGMHFATDGTNLNINRQPDFSRNIPPRQPISNAVPTSRMYPNIPTTHDSSNRRQVFTNNVQGNNSAPNRESSNGVTASQESLKLVMDVSELLELTSNESSYIVAYLKHRKNKLENTVQGSLPHSTLVILMKIVRKICAADSYEEKIQLLKVICCDNFLNILGNYITSLPTHQKDCAKEDLLFLEGSILPFFDVILLLIPSEVCPKLRQLLIQTNLAVSGLEQYQELQIDQATKMKLKQLESIVKRHLYPDSPEVTNEEGAYGLKAEAGVTKKNVEQALKSSPSHATQAQAKHLDFLTRNVFPSVVKKFDVPAQRVKGMHKNMYFVDNGGHNKGNIKEGEFLLALAKYLLKQKYKAENILLLTTSNLDMKNIVELKITYSLEDMTVGIISSFEEFNAAIILISFPVDESEIKQNIYDERQLCKALLGAKNGIYMIGNLSTLENQSPFWKEMKSLLQQHQAVSSALPLLCEIHQIVISASEVSDLKKLKNGACSKRCEHKLKCGHFCKRLCHFDDREHKHYKCHEPCSRKPKKCSMKHSCSKLCHEPCGLCTVALEINNKRSVCYELFIPHNKRGNTANVNQPPANNENTSLLPCGHIVPSKGQSVNGLDLWSNELVTLCQVPCTAVLECEHTCTGTCGSCRQGRVHIPCKDKSKITLSCGHRFVSICSGQVRQCEQKCFYECPHGMCKEKCGHPCTPCKEMCTIGCEHSNCTKKCFELCDRKPCFAACKKLLICGHPCIGLCGEPCPPGPEYCRICNAQTLKKRDSTGDARFVLLSNCGHVVRSNDLDRKAFSKVHKLESLACPLCRYNITKTTRYLNYSKELHRNLMIIRQVHKQYNENLTAGFWKIAKEIRLLSLPVEIENHPKIEEIKKHFQVVQDTKVADQQPMILLMFLRNLLYPIVEKHFGMTSPHHLDWLLNLLLERYEMGICSQVLRELYSQIVEYQKLKNAVYKGYLLELHKAISFFTYLEKNTWTTCAKGHLSTCNSLLTACSSCDGIPEN